MSITEHDARLYRLLISCAKDRQQSEENYFESRTLDADEQDKEAERALAATKPKGDAT